MTISPGQYRAVVVQNNATLLLAGGGSYDFQQVQIKAGGTLQAKAASVVRVLKWFATDNKAVIGPAPGSSIGAGSIVFFVNGTDNTNPAYGKTLVFGTGATVAANFYAPNGTLSISDQASASGSFLARDIAVGKSVQLSLASSFLGLSKRAGQGETPTAQDVPTAFALEQNYPNPFNPSTTIVYQLPDEREVTLTVYNILGQVVKSLVSGTQKAGTYTVRWDGTNDHGMAVGTGIYLYRIQAGTFRETRKMIMMK